MRYGPLLIVLASSAAAAAGIAAAQSAPPVGQAPARQAPASQAPVANPSVQTRAAPYLAPGSFDIVQSLEAAPAKDDPRYASDRAIFKQTRKLVGTPRYALATSDADYTLPALMHDFSCATGVTLTPSTAPRLAALMGRAGADTQRAAGVAKRSNKRQRPFLIDHGPICQPESELADSYDYPSGHTTWGWTWGTILAELAPDRATPIMARARAYGESRVICGAHNASAVEAGRQTATATLSVVRTSPAYQADFAAARDELAALRRSGPAPDAGSCSAEAALVAERDY